MFLMPVSCPSLHLYELFFLLKNNITESQTGFVPNGFLESPAYAGQPRQNHGTTTINNNSNSSSINNKVVVLLIINFNDNNNSSSNRTSSSGGGGGG